MAIGGVLNITDGLGKNNLDKKYDKVGGTISGNVVITGTVAEGKGTTASGSHAHAEGHFTSAQASYSHAEGNGTTASGRSSHTEGYKTTAGRINQVFYEAQHAEGIETKAFGNAAHSEGYKTIAGGHCSHAEGESTVAYGNISHAGGYYTITGANFQTAIGKFNKESTAETDGFIIGNGTNETARSNCLRVTDTNGVYSNSTYKSSGADYAELFQWFDDNPENEDRVGLFVTLDGEKIRLAEAEDDYILGVVSACPSVLGDVYDDQWKGMYEIDIYGRPVLEEVEVPVETIEVPDPENPEQMITKVICEAHTEIRQKLNPDYDPTQEYIPRSERPEWDAVGMLGKLVLIDDGTCEVNGWCSVGNGGIATNSEKQTKFRVMTRLDATHIKIMIL